MRLLTLLMALCTTAAVAGPSPELDLGHTFDATLGVDAKPAQKALGCTGAWEESQLLLGRCDAKAVILLLNWDSKSDSTSISLLYGVADQLLPMIGAR